MGRFIYEKDVRADFDDRALAHLQSVVMAKMRRGEAFSFTCKEDMSTGGGRTSVYLHGHSNVSFTYASARQPALNPAWLRVLTDEANSGRGLSLLPEPAQHEAEQQSTPQDVALTP